MKRWVAWALCTLAAAAGAWCSYGFGRQIGGLLVGVLAGLNGAVMCALLTSALLDRVQRWTS